MAECAEPQDTGNGQLLAVDCWPGSATRKCAGAGLVEKWGWPPHVVQTSSQQNFAKLGEPSERVEVETALCCLGGRHRCAV